MKTQYIIIIGLTVLIVAGLIAAFANFFGNTPGTSTNTRPNEPAEKNDGGVYQVISTGTTGSGDVSIELTPHEIINGRLEVDVSANTHSVDLNQFDLSLITLLETNGKSVPPTSAPALEGHHASGTLVFDVGEDISSFTIRIAGIPKVEDREYVWSP